MSSCLSGGTGRAYGFDLESIVKWQSTTSSRTTSHSSSPSSTLCESSNSPITISNQKPRTPRKRPNQTYNEAAALLSTACPNIFSNKHLTKNNKNLPKFTKIHSNLFNEPSELISPFQVIENSGFLLHQPIIEKPSSLIERKVAGLCQSPVEIEFRGDWNWNCSNSLELGDGYGDDFDTESMLDEEIEEGIDSIMGNSDSVMEKVESNDNTFCNFKNYYGYPLGLGFGEFNSGFGMRNGVRALRNVDEGNWWSFPAVEVVSISTEAPAKPKKAPVEKKKFKNMEELTKRSESELELGQGNLNSGDGSLGPEIGSRLLLKLNYDAVLNAWSDKASPLPEEIFGSKSPGGDIHARLGQLDLFSENGGLGESSVARCKEKKRTHLCSKKISYQGRKPNSNRRSRSKGRFVRRPNSPNNPPGILQHPTDIVYQASQPIKAREGGKI